MHTLSNQQLSLNAFSVFSEYLDEVRQYGPTYTQWAGLEEELADPLKAVASCVEQCSKESEEQIQHLSEVLVPTLHEYVLCAETLKVSPVSTCTLLTSANHGYRDVSDVRLGIKGHLIFTNSRIHLLVQVQVHYKENRLQNASNRSHLNEVERTKQILQGTS